MPNKIIAPADLDRFLKSVPLLQGIGDSGLGTLVEHCRIRLLNKGELLFNQMDPGGCVLHRSSRLDCIIPRYP